MTKSFLQASNLVLGGRELYLPSKLLPSLNRFYNAASLHTNINAYVWVCIQICINLDEIVKGYKKDSGQLPCRHTFSYLKDEKWNCFLHICYSNKAKHAPKNCTTRSELFEISKGTNIMPRTTKYFHFSHLIILSY